MELSEIRIGNKILCNKEEIEVCINDFCEWEDNESVYCLEPIPLTVKRLLDFGFIFPDGLIMVKGNTHGIVIDIYNGIRLNIREYSLKIELKYVHRFQNLWFELTGEELIARTQK